MEEEEVDCPSPSLLIFRGKEQEIMTFCSKDGEVMDKELPLELKHKELSFQLCRHGLVIVWNEQDNESNHSFSLWNPITMENHDFPALNLTPKHEINNFILTEPLGNPDCMLILFAMSEKGHSLIYRSVSGGDHKWNEQFIDIDELEPDTVIWKPVMCNGKIYCLVTRIDTHILLGVIAIKPDGFIVNFSALNIRPREYRQNTFYYRDMIESCGELFIIDLLYDKDGEEFEGVSDVEVFKMDMDGRWHVVESFEDRAFFFCLTSSFSCPAPEPGIKGNHVYFLLPDDGILFAYNMEDETVLYSEPLPEEVCSLICWFKNDLRSIGLKDTAKCIKSSSKERIEKTTSEITLQEGGFSTLHLDLLVEIRRRLQFTEYMNFRTVNTKFRSAAPLKRWSRLASEGSAGNVFSPPLLMSQRVRNNVWNLVDPLYKDGKYFITRNNEMQDAIICYSKGEWCMVLHGKDSISLWNPFTKNIISLPTLHYIRHLILGCSFSSKPDSPESDCTIVVFHDLLSEYCISFIKLGGEHWDEYLFKPFSNLNTIANNYPIFYKGAIYFLDEVGVYEVSDTEEVYDVFNHVIKCPCESFHQKYLLECDNQLLAVFVESSGKPSVQVFKLDKAQMTWTGVKDIGNHTLYLSQISAFSAIAPHGMQNRIYLPRYYDDKSIIYYSLESGVLHSHGSDEVLEDFYNTSEKLSCCWVIPTL